MTETMSLFADATPVPRTDGPGLRVWSVPRTHWRHYIEPGTKLKNELVDCGVWWVAQYGNGTECCGVCPWLVASDAVRYAKERA